MSRDDEAGAVAAAEYFLDLYTYTESTQDTGPWEAMSHPDCVFCKSVVDHVAAMRAAGKVDLAAPMRRTTISSELLNPLVFSVKIEITTGPDEIYSLDGQLIERTTVVVGTSTIVVLRQAATWITRGVDLAEQE